MIHFKKPQQFFLYVLVHTIYLAGVHATTHLESTSEETSPPETSTSSKFLSCLKNNQVDVSDCPLIAQQGNHIIMIKEEWCNTCKKMLPVIQEAQKLFKDLVSFQFMNVEAAGELGFSPDKIPTIVYYQDGSPVHKTTGFDAYVINTIKNTFNLFINPITDILIAESKLSPFDVVIIGSGPAGIAASTHAARSGLRHIILTGEQPGGTIMSVKEVHNWPGMAHIQGSDLGKYLMEDSAEQQVFFVYDTAIDLIPYGQKYRIETKLGKQLYARTVLIATGTTHVLPAIPFFEQYLGKNVAICATCDAASYRNKKVMIYGNYEQAVHHIQDLLTLVQKIILVVPEVTIDTKLEQMAHHYKNKIEVIRNWSLFEIYGDGQKINEITLQNNENSDEYENIDVDGIFLALGQTPNTVLCKKLVAADAYGFLRTNNNYQCLTKNDIIVAGLFAAGDVTTAHLKQAVIASAQGLVAMTKIKEYLQK